MRLWHKNLISVLPRQQLVAQWRECCAIAKDWAEKGRTNHILINKVMSYPICHFYCYTQLVLNEMKTRGYRVMTSTIERFINNLRLINREREEESFFTEIEKKYLFKGWHTSRYYQQCYYNLEEKFDCGGLTEEEWDKIIKNKDKFTAVSK